MSETTFRRTPMGILALSAALTGAFMLTGCDQATNSGPQASTTPASTTTEPVAAPEPEAEPTPESQTQDTPKPRTALNPDGLTPEGLRAQRERTMLEQQGVVFSDDPAAQPRIMLRGETNQHGGVIYAREPVRFEFQLYNGGTSDLVLSRISSSCGCTVPDRTGLVDVAFAPGEDLPPLKVEYTPKGPGDSSKIVTLFTNDPTTPVLRLRVGAELAALAKAFPEDIRPGELRAGREHVVTFDVMSYDPAATISSITLPKMEGMLEFRPLPTQPIDDPESEYKSKIPVEIVFPAALGQQRLAGNLDIKVLATPPGKSEQVESPVTARLVANLAGDLRFTRPFARVQMIEAGQPYTFTSNLTAASGRDFTITRVVAYDRRSQREIQLEATYERVEQARVPTWRLTLEGVTPEAAAVSGELIVYTSLEDEAPAKMTFSGFRAPRKTDDGKPNQPRVDPRVPNTRGAQ